MAKLLKLRRGTTSQHSSFTGAEGEVTVDTTKDTLVVHDGSTAGGTPLAKESDNLSLIDEDNMSTNSATRPPSQQSVKAYVDALPDVIDEDNMSSDSATRPPSQQSVKAYADTKAPAILDEDNLGSDSATRPPSQQSVKAYVDGQTLTLIDEDNLGSDSAARPPSQQSVKAYVDTNFAPKAAPTFTGTATGANLTLSGNLTVNGTTTTVATTNTTLTDNLLELNSGASSNANDCGILIERGSTGNNAIIAWDESADKFTVGTTTGTASSTGNISITTGTIVANVEGNVTGNLTGTASAATNADTVDSLHAASFVRSDASDTLTGGTYNINSNTDNKIILSGANNPYITWEEGTTAKAKIQWSTSGYLQFVNEEDGSVLRLKDHLTLSWDGSTHYDVLHQGNLGSSGALSNKDVYLNNLYASDWIRVSGADKGIYNSANSNYLYSDDANYWAVGYYGSEGGLRIRDGFNGTIRGAVFATDSNGIGFTDNNSIWSLQTNRGTNQCHLYDQHFISDTNNSYDLGTTSARWRNGYFGTKVYDSKGDLRRVPSTSPSSNHVATAADAGKVIYIAYDVHFNPSVFSAGDVVTVINNSGNDETIHQGSNFTLYNTADASTGNRTLAGRGMCTVWFADHNIAYISGAGLS